ncbi:MAG: aminopeptidase N [Propionibacteriaceae bacterium]|jgi:aminopeptidase N|nr:aminopeptidase N [Propionibacteriaceae bacterium]
MNPANITRAEAAERSAIIETHSYEVSIDVTGSDPATEAGKTFVSTSAVTFTSNGAPTWIDLIAERVIGVSLDGETLDPASYANNRFPVVTPAGPHTLTITAVFRYSRTGEGLHRFVDPADERVYLYTQLESADARRVFACFEQPDLKATFQFTLTTPADWLTFSNSPTPPPEPIFDNQVFRFAPTKRISTYITAIIAGEYFAAPGEIHTRNGRSIGAAVVCRTSMSKFLDADVIRTTTQRGFEVYEEAFGTDYAFDSYDQVFVPEFNAGAMENAGCVTFRDEYLFRSRVTSAQFEARDGTILHELAHMWFGDLVTMRWWDDLWLNESFAEWASYYCQAAIVARYGGGNPWVSFANARKGWAFVEDQLPTTHPVAADMVDLEAVEQNFDGITYAKGASVLKQLVSLVDEPQYLAGVHAYLAAHAFGNATFDDLLGALSAASGRDLSHFAADWLETAGMNTLRSEVQMDASGHISQFSIVQTAPPEHPHLRTHRMAIGCYDLLDGKLVAGERLNLDVSGERTDVLPLVGRVRPALVLLNEGDMTFAKPRLDDVSLATVEAHIAELSDPLSRAMAWTSAWDAWRDAELPSGAYIDLVLATLPDETNLTAVQNRLGTLLTASRSYSAPAVRAVNRAHVTSGIAKLLVVAERGSDKQVALADSLIASISTSTGGAVLEAWLAGEEVPAGLELDVDRRWAILTSLAAQNRLDEAQLAAQERADTTISGVEKAAGVRSAWATAAAKADAWARIAEDPDVPNATLRAITGNFWCYGQESLLAEYAGQYLELCEAISAKSGKWESPGSWITDMVMKNLWPEPVADRAFLDHFDAWLAERPNLAPSVAHTLAQQRNLAERILAAQEASLK